MRRLGWERRCLELLLTDEISLLLIGCHSAVKCFKSRYKCYFQRNGGRGDLVGEGCCFGDILALTVLTWGRQTEGLFILDRGAHWTKKWICTICYTKLRGANLVLKILLIQVNERSDWPSLVCRCGFAFTSVSKTNVLLANMSQICRKNWRVGWSLFFSLIWFSPIVKYGFEDFFCNG